MHVPAAATGVPIAQVPPVPIVNVPPAAPTFVAAMAVGVIAAALLLVTVTVPECAVVVPVTREGTGAENATVTSELVPLRVTGEPVTVQPAAASVIVLALKVPAAAGKNCTARVHEVPAAKVRPQVVPVPESEKGCGVPPPKVTTPPLRVTLPVLVTVTFWTLVVPAT